MRGITGVWIDSYRLGHQPTLSMLATVQMWVVSEFFSHNNDTSNISLRVDDTLICVT